MQASGEPARSDLAGSRSLPGIQEMTRKRLWIVVAVLLAIVFSVWRWIGHAHTEADDQNHPLATSAETVAAVARAERHNVGNTLTIAGEFKPFQDVNVHAKVAGYIKVIHVDVGDHVKAGQTLAVLEIPELAAQLAGADAGVRRSKEEIRRAEGDLARAQSAHAASHSAYARLKQAAESRSGLVAQQEIDDSQAKDLEFEAQVSSSSAALSSAQQQLQIAEANQKQYSALSDYSRIIAPFSGVVTARYADTGALIAAGTSSGTQSIPVVRLAQISKLRLVLPIPESVAAQIHLGDPVKVHVQALNQEIVGKVSRFADSLDRQTRNAYLSVTAVDSNPGSRLAAGGLNNPILFPRAAAGATVGQLITDFGRSTNLLSSSEYQAKAEDQNAAATSAQIILAVDQAFYNVLETKALVAVAQQTVDSRQLLVDKIKALTDAKLKSELDLSFTRVDLARGRLLLLEAHNNYQTSLAALSAILGYSDEQEFQLVEEPAAIAAPALDVLPLIQQALQQRPEVAALQNEVEAAQKFSSAEHDLRRPSLSALGVVGEAPVRDNHIPNWYGAVGLNVNIPIFSGFLFNARAKAADLQTEVNRQKLADLRNNIARDVRTSWQDTMRAYERLSVTQQLREQASLVFDLAQSRYNLGLGSIVEFSQAELGKTEADIADTDAKYQYRLTQIVLAYSISSPK